MGMGGGSLANNTGVSILNKYYGFFIQDDYRVTPKLTLNLGLRYEYETPRTERYDRATRGLARGAARRVGGRFPLGGVRCGRGEWSWRRPVAGRGRMPRPLCGPALRTAG